MEKFDIRPFSVFTELAAIRESVDSKSEVDPKTEIAVGVLPEYLKRLYTLWQRTEMLVGAISEEEESATEPEKAVALHCQGCSMLQKAKLIEVWFFQSVRDEYNLWDGCPCPEIAIKKGFQVVKLTPEEQTKKKGPSGLLVIGVLEEGDKFGKN